MVLKNVSVGAVSYIYTTLSQDRILHCVAFMLIFLRLKLYLLDTVLLRVVHETESEPWSMVQV